MMISLLFRDYQRNAMFPLYLTEQTSVSKNLQENAIYIVLMSHFLSNNSLKFLLLNILLNTI